MRQREACPATRPARKPPLWRCPRCGHRFVTRDQWHSCGRYRLADHFRGKDPAVRRVLDRLVALARDCGPVTAYAQKIRIVIQARARFAGGVARKRWFVAGLWLRRRAMHPTLCRVEDLGPLGLVHHFRVSTPAQFDTAFARLVREAYRVGCQERP